MKKSNTPIPVRMGNTEFLKINAERGEWRDLYHLVLSLRWSHFILLVIGIYLAINLLFAAAYFMGGDCIAEMPRGSFWDAFFFSIETLATVGYGHMHPVTTYGHVVVSIEIIVGMFWMAVMTGLIFVRFSRPTARVLFSKVIALAPFDGQPTLMIRVANGRHQSMVETEFRITLHRDELVAEGTEERRFYTLKLTFDHLIMFPTSITLRHIIDVTSPLHGATRESLQESDTRFMASVVGVDTVIPAPMQSQQDYSWKDVRFGEKFVDVYAQSSDGRYTVDYARLHETEAAE